MNSKDYRNKFWMSIYASVFRSDAALGTMYMQRVGITDINWGTEIGKLCQYCGQEWKDGDTCPGCGQKVVHTVNSLGRAVVKFEGILPYASDLFYFNETATYYVTHRSCGMRALFLEEEVILKFTLCKVIGKRILGVVAALDPGDDTIMTMQTLVECNVEMFPDNGW